MNAVSSADFDKLTSGLPALRQHGRQGVEFIPFDAKFANEYCGSSYVIPFVSETECLVTRRSNGKWVLPGGTLEPGENWIEAAHRQLMEETGAVLDAVMPLGMYHCVSTAERPRLPHLPHPVHVRVVSCANANQVSLPSDPDGHSTITEVRTISYDRTANLFSADDQDYAALYHLAFLFRQRQKSMPEQQENP